MKGFFVQDLKRSFLNPGFFVGIAVISVLLFAALITGAPLDRSRA